jgi:hypothetical protein
MSTLKMQKSTFTYAASHTMMANIKMYNMFNTAVSLYMEENSEEYILHYDDIRPVWEQ